jgi:hypothetical protein
LSITVAMAAAIETCADFSLLSDLYCPRYIVQAKLVWNSHEQKSK